MRTHADRTPPLVWLYAVLDGRARPALTRLPRLPHGAGRPRAIQIDAYLTAIVADAPASEFGAAALEAHVADAEWIGACAAAHHGVIERLPRARAVVPFRVLTIFESDARVKATLAPMRATLRAGLARVRGRGEWVVRVFRPGKPAPAPIPKLIRSGAEFLRARRDIQLAQETRARAVAESAASVARGLADVADEHVLRPIDAGAGAIIDAAYLVRTPRATKFRRSLDALSRELREHGCRVTLTGPWPPYSFVALGDRIDA